MICHMYLIYKLNNKNSDKINTAKIFVNNPIC